MVREWQCRTINEDGEMREVTFQGADNEDPVYVLFDDYQEAKAAWDRLLLCNNRQVNFIVREQELLRKAMEQIGIHLKLYKACEAHLALRPADFTSDAAAEQN